MADPAAPSDAVSAVQWPSAWPDLWPGVLARAALPLTACLITLVGLAWLGDLSLSWWVPLLPAPLLIGPVRRPGRVRRGFAAAAADGRLSTARGRDGGVRCGPIAGVDAVLRAGGGVRYVDAQRRPAVPRG